MMARVLAAARLAALLIAFAASTSTSRALPAGDLLTSCRDALRALGVRIAPGPGADLCIGYFSSVQTFLRIETADKFPVFAVCTPRDVEIAELIRLFVDALDQAEAADRRIDAVVIAMHAYRRAYPCP